MKSAAKRARIVRLGAWLILVLALLPNISYMGHWTEMAGAAHDHHDSDEPAGPGIDGSGVEAHAAHCHAGPAHCGGGESMIGTAFVGDNTEGLALTGHESRRDSVRTSAAISGHAAPILQPPRSA